MLKAALVLAGVGCVTAAFVIEWRVALLMLAGWWADNILKKLVDRDR